MLGKHKHTIDAKNRIFLPAKYRDELGNDLVVAKSITGDCLRVYTSANWEKYEAKIRELPEIEAEEASFWLTTNAEHVRVDDQGRIAILPDYRDYANLDKEIVSCGRGEYMEIWNAKTFEDRQASVDVSKLREALRKRGF
ncbi:MAG: division/cell wall cluster transcriptional repressor MraZ [Clostridia bacterium]|nr:division/cell wall cluster transcriptional repressor MraZ [Clostridia bacterium]